MITVRDLSVSLSTRRVLSNIAFSARPGRVFAIAGPNGSGKSTLLKALAGELPYAGDAMLNGHQVSRTKAVVLAGMRGVLPQSSTVAFPFSVAEVVSFGLTASRHNDLSLSEEMISHALDRVGLGGYEERAYLELSGGEQQRVQLARVLCQIPKPVENGKPCWLFLDEPVSSLDIRHQLTIMQLAREFAGGGGGVIAVMHDLNLTALFADDLMLLKNGRVVGVGPLREIMLDDTLSRAYSCSLKVNRVPEGPVPFVLPHTAAG
jgi:iron complex transport system ATP-binding protein